MKIGAEGRPVVVEIEHTDFPAAGRMEIQAATDFVRHTVIRSGVASGPRDSNVGARAPNQGFDKRRGTKAIMPAVEITRAEMISIEDSFGAVDGYEVVAAIADELQPWFEVPAERPHSAV